jgi:two-component system, chemotaxis family, sensor kinase CheA
VAVPADVPGDLEALRADREMAGLFVSEAREHLANIEAIVLRIEHAPGDKSLVDAAYRSFHTIKGNAYTIGAKAVGELAHGIESLLDPIRSEKKRLAPRDVDAMFEALDGLKEMIDGLSRGLQTPGIAPGDHPLADESSTIKVDTSRLDTLVDMVGELMILQAMIRENCPELTAAEHPAARQFASAERLLSELQRVSLSLRMVPLRRTFRRVSRAVRDVSHACGKPVDLTLLGETTELDRHVIEQIVDPLLHLVRNAVDHGIEDAGTRERCGKPARAQMAVRASQREAHVCLEISDDGRGLDAARIYAKAVSLGLVQDGDTLPLPQVHDLIFEPGFSTADEVTDLSGRGVGLDVVRQNVQALGGRVEVRTSPGQGTTFVLKVPLTMAILKGVVVSVGADRFVLPAHSLREAVRPVECEVHRGPDGRSFVSLRGMTMPFVELAGLLGGHSSAERGDGVVLVLEVDGRRAALRADAVFGVQEFVVKPLKTLDRMCGFSGGTVLGDGSISLICDAAGLFDLIEAAARVAA